LRAETCTQSSGTFKWVGGASEVIKKGKPLLNRPPTRNLSLEICQARWTKFARGGGKRFRIKEDVVTKKKSCT